MKKLQTDTADPVRRRRLKSKSLHQEDEKESKGSKDETLFLGVRITKEVHQRLYRAKASLEFSTGKFYGMGRLLERVIRYGLERVENELDKLEDK